MIHLSSIDSIFETVYLGEKLNDKPGACNIHVNPESIKYLTGKTVIINKLGYPEENIEGLLKNLCTVISRVSCDVDGVLVSPYFLRPVYDIMWNGREVDKVPSCLEDLFEGDTCQFSLDSYKLYFPKISGLELGNPLVSDKFGNLTGLGWALQQVGVNLRRDTPFVDLDILKTGKIKL